MRYVIEIRTDNAAFEPHPGEEVAEILGDLAYKARLEARSGHSRLYEGSLRDANGNTVGEAYRVCTVCGNRVDDHYPEQAEACDDAMHDRLEADPFPEATRQARLERGRP